MGGNSLITCSAAEPDGQQRLEIAESPTIPLSTTESDHDSNLAHGSCYNDTSCTQDDISLADGLEEELIRETGAIELVNECREEASLAGTGLFIDQDIARFEERFLAAVTEMVEYPRRVPYPDYKQLPRAQRAMSTAFYTIFNTSSPTSITALLLGKVPTCVRKALGGVQPTFGDLLALPEPTVEQKASWIVYFDGTVRWEMEDDPKDPLQRRKTDRIVRRGKYVGSSVDCRGGGTRLDRHISVAITKRSVESRQLHHAELCEQGTEANLRILAAFDRDPRCKPYVPLLETIFMALVGTFVGREKTGQYNPEACYDLYDRIRARGSVPGIEGDGLNKAPSIHQGMIGHAVARQTFFCMTCNRELKPDTPERDHARLVEAGNPTGQRRCQSCHLHHKKHGQERVPNANGSFTRVENRGQKREQHRLWVAAGNPDVCGNSACVAPRGLGSSFSGFMSDARCANCASFLKYQAKKNIPKDKRQERQPQARELKARNYIWTHDEDALLRKHGAKGVAGTKWSELVVSHFPLMTAQSLKERFVFLKKRDSAKGKPNGAKREGRGKALNWTDAELQLLKEAIREGRTAKSLSKALVGREITAINTKMSWLRKVKEQI